MNAGDDSDGVTENGDGEGDHGLGADAELLVQKRGVLGVFADGVLAETLSGSVDEGDEADAEGLLEIAEKAFGIRSDSDEGDEVALACEPDGGILDADMPGRAPEHFFSEAGGPGAEKPAV